MRPIGHLVSWEPGKNNSRLLTLKKQSHLHRHDCPTLPKLQRLCPITFMATAINPKDIARSAGCCLLERGRGTEVFHLLNAVEWVDRVPMNPTCKDTTFFWYHQMIEQKLCKKMHFISKNGQFRHFRTLLDTCIDTLHNPHG